MERLLVRDVRCFRGQREVSLAPLTLLVGENSTGKSTLLALARVAWDVGFGITGPDFNEEPFHLGAYAEIAHYHGGQGGRVRNFSVGADINAPSLTKRGSSRRTYGIGTFTSVAGQPALSGLEIGQGPYKVRASLNESGLEFDLSTPNNKWKIASPEEFGPREINVRNLYLFVDSLAFRGRRDAGADDMDRAIPDEDLRLLAQLTRNFVMRGPLRRGFATDSRPYAIAPIRTKPKRTYDPLGETRSPEGEHVPMLLARLQAAKGAEWDGLVNALSDYGANSGLFEWIKVKRFAGGEATPFQVRVKLKGQRAEVNLVDVGYGVSQVLPLLVDCLISSRQSLFLLQQPEVHLHPRAQAEVGSFLASQVRTSKQRFLVETHSDHLLDRVRLEVRRGGLNPQQVGILFFERQAANVVIHKMSLDERGNLREPPSSYREFFVREELDLLGLSS
jgi:hypothetical protein